MTPRHDGRLCRWAFLGLILVAVGTVCALFRDFGITWDEPNQNQYGKYVLRYYETFFRDKAALTYIDAFLYGGLFDSIAAFFVRVSPFGEFETRHLLNALVGVVGIIGTWKLAHLLAGCRAALLAAVLLFLEPSYFGHMFNNPKDIPFAVGYIWSLYYLLASFNHFPRVPNSLILRAGLAIGLTLGVRVGGFMLLGYLGLAALVYLAFPAWFSENPLGAGRPGHRLSALLKSLAGVSTIAYAVMLIFWPWAQQNPLINPIRALSLMSHFGLKDSGLVAQVLLGGEYVHAKHLPASYLLHYFAVKMPGLILVSLGLGAAMAIWSMAKGNRAKEKLQLLQYGFLIFAVLFPVLYVILNQSVLYDTMRHFLFIVPCLCVISGIALGKISLVLGQGARWRQICAPALLAVILLPQAGAIIQLHPHQYVFYNLLAGGVKGAQGRYEMDYWGNSYKEAVEVLADYVQKSESLGFQRREYRVAALGPVFSASYFFPENFKITRKAEEADFVISFTRWNFHQRAPGDQILAVKRMGAELSVIKDNREPVSGSGSSGTR